MSNDLPILNESLYESELEAIFQKHTNGKIVCKTTREEIKNRGGVDNLMEANNLNDGFHEFLVEIALRQRMADQDKFGLWISETYHLIKGKIKEFILKNSSNKSDFVKNKLGWLPNHDDLLLQILNKFRHEESMLDIFNKLHPPIDDDKYFTLCRDADLYLNEVWKGNDNIIIENNFIRQVILNWHELSQNEKRKEKALDDYARRYLDCMILIEDELVKLENINPLYFKFWMQFTKLNPKNKTPYMMESDVNIFLNQAFSGKPIERTFYPDIKAIELRHAAWLFQNQFNFDKARITRIMIDNFTCHFSQDEVKFKMEYSNIKDQDPERTGKRVFQKI